MSKKAVSVTLESDNLLWLKGRAGATGVRSMSELLDRLISEARAGGAHHPVRSVVGTIDVDPNDPWLEHADAAVGAMVDTSLNRPSRIKESSARYGAARSKKKRRG